MAAFEQRPAPPEPTRSQAALQEYEKKIVLQWKLAINAARIAFGQSIAEPTDRSVDSATAPSLG